MNQLKKQLCEAMCADISLTEVGDGSYFVSTPFIFPDGDTYAIYLNRLPSGGWRITDHGLTMMHLSYDFDIDKLKDGTRAKIFEQILGENGLQTNDGELFIETPADTLTKGIFTFGQGITRIHDLSLMNRINIESTFYDDLKEKLAEICGDELEVNYTVPGIVDQKLYPIDFAIVSKKPLYIFGVSNKEKARLATIILQHLQKSHAVFRSLIVYQDMWSIPRSDLSRLTAAANDQIPSLDNMDDLERKITDAIAA